jgi:FtsH-binding integral membrane protein
MSSKSSTIDTQINRKFWMSLGAMALALVVLSFTAFRGGRPSCRFFIPSIYMYLIVAIMLIGVFTLWHEKNAPQEDRGKTYELSDPKATVNFVQGFFYGCGALLLLILYFVFGMYNWKNHWLNHVVWIAILYGLSFGFYAIYKMRVAREYMGDAGLYVVVLFFVMSGLVYSQAKKFQAMNNATFSLIGNGLLAALLTIIIASLLLLFSGAPLTSFVSAQKIILYAAILIFSLYISYDTIYILKRTKSCNENSPTAYPNYPMESFMIFIDLYNIFIDLLQLRLLNSLQ